LILWFYEVAMTSGLPARDRTNDISNYRLDVLFGVKTLDGRLATLSARFANARETYRAARGSVSPRKMACRARSRGGRLERSKAIDSRHGVARLLPLNFLRLRRAPKEKAPPQRG
jgi:hypothetical protein